MFRKRDPQQSLFSAAMVLPEDKRRRLERDWPGEFRRSALPLIDEEAFRDLYHRWNGRPNKPIQTVVGVLLLKEMHDLTDEQALFNLDFNLAWHVALDLTPEEAHTCQKTLHNFRPAHWCAGLQSGASTRPARSSWRATGGSCSSRR